jgi:UDP-GlcNAc:undecaprenyl-phosphate GlcNAc-1-phosphate transferase
VLFQLVLIFAVSCLLSVLANWTARGAARRVGLVDRPDGHRKLQSHAVPLAGGVAIFIATIITIAGIVAYDESWRGVLLAHAPEACGLLVAGTIILVVGFLDDLFGLRGRQKLLGQVAAAAVTVSFGVCIRRVHIFDFSFDLGIFAGPLTIFWLIGAINALNLLDGIDALVAILGIIFSAAIAGMAFMTGHETISLIACALAGSLSGFLRFNLPPASVYLGDAGSMLIGLVIGVLAIQASLMRPGTVLLASHFRLHGRGDSPTIDGTQHLRHGSRSSAPSPRLAFRPRLGARRTGRRFRRDIHCGTGQSVVAA